MPATIKKQKPSVKRPPRRRTRGLPTMDDFPELKKSWNPEKGLPTQLMIARCNYLSQLFHGILKRKPPMIDFYEIICALRNKKIPFVVIGLYGNSHWLGESRATDDVDILVKSGRNFTRALKTLKALYPDLETREFTGLTAFFRPGDKISAIDLIYPHSADLAQTLENGVWIKDRGIGYQIPTLEGALASKYGAMLNSSRPPERRAQDAVDFLKMVLYSNDPSREPLDLERLREFGSLIWLGGGDEIVRLATAAKEGKVPPDLIA